MIQVTLRRPDESGDDWNRRRQLAPQYDLVRRRRDAYLTHEPTVIQLRLQVRVVTAVLVVGVLFFLVGVAASVLEAWLDGLGPIIAIMLPVGGVLVLGALTFTDSIAKFTAQRGVLRDLRRAYDDAFADYVDAGGGTDLADARLLLDAS